MATPLATLPESGTLFDNDEVWQSYWAANMQLDPATICRTCVLNSHIGGVKLDPQGVCNYCRMQADLEQQYPGGNEGWREMKRYADQIRSAGRRKKYDVIVGVSGGCDSSYMLHLAKNELGLRPLAVHFDNTWNSTIATENIMRMTRKLGIDLYTHVVDNEEFDDSILAFLRAGVPDLDIQTDLGLAATMNRAAEKFGLQYVFEGHSFRSEGICPSGWIYMDSRYLQSIQQQYGTRQLKTLPHMWLSSQLKWMLFTRLRKVRPLWILDYNKEQTKEMLTAEYDWQWYGGHHLENRIQAFVQTYFRPRRWGHDLRAMGYSGLIRSHQMDREQALAELRVAQPADLALVELVKKRLNLTHEEFLRLMNLPKKSYRDFRSYKKTFERMSPFFYLMAKMDLIPWSFYLKYTRKENAA